MIPAGLRTPHLPGSRAGWRRICDAWARFEASRAADVAGGVIVAATVYAIFFLAGALG